MGSDKANERKPQNPSGIAKIRWFSMLEMTWWNGLISLYDRASRHVNSDSTRDRLITHRKRLSITVTFVKRAMKNAWGDHLLRSCTAFFGCYKKIPTKHRFVSIYWLRGRVTAYGHNG